MNEFAILIICCVIAVAVWQFTVRRKAEAALKEARDQIRNRERKIQTILDNAPIVFSAIDKSGIFQISEGKGLEKLGRKNNQSVGVSIYDMHNRNPIILDAVERSMRGEQVATSFVLNGVSYDLFMGPEKNADGVVTGVSMLSVDITDRKRVEEEKAQLAIREQTAIATSKLKSEFLANMSHEIRTPINGVIGMTSLLMDTPLSPQQKEFAEGIKESGTSLLAVINDILDFSKIEAGKLDFEEIDFGLNELVNHAVKSLRFTAGLKGIALVVEMPALANPWVKGDPNRFRQILNNLVGNAIKFTKEGQVLVRVVSDEKKKEPGRTPIRVEIVDTGIGISTDGMAKMFQAFSQGETSMARRFGGTGLGLSISKQLVDRMGGEIGVESAEGRGSTFWFTVPFITGEAPSEELVAKSSKPARKVIQSESAPRVLVAEDNRINQKITVRMLENMGCSPSVVANGIEALEALRASSYDLVLMDCQMPQMDGPEATKKFRADGNPVNRGIPIVAMTANAMKGDKELCLAAGMDDYVSKPVSYEELSAVVARWLEIHRARTAAIAANDS